jgi:hypothetical protein
MDYVGYVVAGYLLTAGGLVAYAASLRVRARRARARAEVVTERGRLKST